MQLSGNRTIHLISILPIKTTITTKYNELSKEKITQKKKKKKIHQLSHTKITTKERKRFTSQLITKQPQSKENETISPSNYYSNKEMASSASLDKMETIIRLEIITTFK